WLTETATYWYLAPEVKSGEVEIGDIKTEVFCFPSTQIAEYDGSFTNTQRMLQWHSFAAKAPGDCRTDSWFYHNLAKRLKKAYAGSKLPRDEGWNKLTWDFDPDAGEEPLYPGELSARKVLREINGYQTADPKQHLKGFGELKDDGSTTCASWIYCGCFPAWDQNLTARRDQGARCPTEAGRHRPRRPVRHSAVHHESGREGLAVRAGGPGGRPAADALRAARVAGQEPAVQAADQPRAQGVGAGEAVQPARRGGRSEVPLRHQHIPAHRALSGGRDEPLAALARRAATGAVHRDRPGPR